MALDVRKFVPENTTITNGKFKCDLSVYGTVRQILVDPPTANTKYDIGIKDENGMIVFVRYNQVGILATEDLGVILFPGLKELIIENSNQDGDFKLKVIYQM